MDALRGLLAALDPDHGQIDLAFCRFANELLRREVLEIVAANLVDGDHRRPVVLRHQQEISPHIQFNAPRLAFAQ